VLRWAQASNTCPFCKQKFTGLTSSNGDYTPIEDTNAQFDDDMALFDFAEGPAGSNMRFDPEEIFGDDWLPDSPLSPLSHSDDMNDVGFVAEDRKSPYVCDFDSCGKVFASDRKSDFDRHLLSHQNIRNFVCDIKQCGARFKLAHDLVKHSAVHSRERPFVCERCGQKFKLKGNYTRHLLLHKDEPRERTHSCSQCNRSFFWRGDLNRHLRVHREREFQCSIENCDKKFVQQAHLFNHLNRIHNITVSDRKTHARTFSNKRKRSQTSISTSSSPTSTRKKGRRTSKEEKVILLDLFAARQVPTKDDLQSLCEQLGEGWDKLRLQKWFKNRRDYVNRKRS